MEHSLIMQKISLIRNEKEGTNKFRKLIEEISILMSYEVLRDLSLKKM